MSPASSNPLLETVDADERGVLEDWVKAQLTSEARRADLLNEKELREESRRFLQTFRAGLADGSADTRGGGGWSDARDLLKEVSRSRAIKGFSPAETATFVFSLKQPVFARLRARLKDAPEALADETWKATRLIDGLALFTTEVYQEGREELIRRQQQELMELSTPVVQLWDGVLALPLIGTLDSARTQVVMENLLQEIVRTGSTLAIIDITGVPTVDTLVAQHLLKTVAAARLMGADCIISGIRPQIAQTIVHLGVELGDVTTKATLKDAFAIALKRHGLTVVRQA
jgi:rsbT co-antagonist protein RsbR